MKRLVFTIGIVVILAAWAIVFLRKRPMDEPKGARKKGSGAPKTEVRGVGALESRYAEAPRQSDRLTLPLDEDSQLAPRARELMHESLQTFQRIELEKRNFTRQSPGEVLLNGLQRKLFLDDYTYATILSGGDCSGAGRVYTNVLQQIETLNNQELEQGIIE